MKRHHTQPKTCAIYIRTAVQSQASIDAQRAACRQYAQRKGMCVVREYVDEARSGADMKRYGLQCMLSGARSGSFQVVVVQHFDRLTRSLCDTHTIISRLQSQGIRFATVTPDRTIAPGPTTNYLLGLISVIGDIGGDE